MSEEELAFLQDTYWNVGRAAPSRPQDRQFHLVMPTRAAGVIITPDTALELSTVWRCGEVIAGALSSSDWNVRVYTTPRNWRKNPEDPIHYLLNTRPNPEMTARSFKNCISIAKVFWGNGYAEIVKDKAGRPIELWPIAPDRVDVIRDVVGLGYKVKNDDGTEVILRPNEILHFRGTGITGLVGDNIITRAAHTLALSLAAEKFAEAYFENNAMPGIVIEYPEAKEMDDVTYQRFKDSWERRHRGPNRAFRFGVVDGGAKIHQLAIDAQKAQITESRSHQIKEICRWFGVPPHMVGHLEDATLNNIEHLGIEFTRSTLRPHAREYEEECDYKLFSPRGAKRKIKIDLEWASQGDFKTRMEGYQIGRGMGVYSANEIREKEGDDAIGPEGDIRIVNSAAVKLEDVGKNLVEDGSEPATTTDKPNDDVAQAVVRAWFCATAERACRRYENRMSAPTKEDAAVYARRCRKDARDYLVNELAPVLTHVVAAYGSVNVALVAKTLDDILDKRDVRQAFEDLVKSTKE